MRIFNEKQSVKTGARGTLLALSVCFKREKASDVSINFRISERWRTRHSSANLKMINRFFVPEADTYCKQITSRSSLQAVKKLSVFICVNLWLIFFCFSANAQTRAVWVRPFINADVSVRKDESKTREHIRAELARIKRAKFDTVFVETFWDGYTIYPSKVVRQRPLNVPSGTAREDAKNFDVLQIYLDEAARLDLKIDAWMHIFHQWNTNLGEPSRSPLFSKHPEWMVLDMSGSPLVRSEAEGANRDVYKVFMSPSHAGVRKLLTDVMREMVEKYPNLGGVQLDYIRYPLHQPDAPFDFSKDALAQFKRDTKLDARNLKTDKEKRLWQDWKTAKVTETVELLSDEVKRKRPQWEISVAVFPDFENTLRVKMQDSRAWAKKGYINAFYPMLYSPNFEKVEAWAQEFRAGVKPPMKVFLTLYVSHFYKNGNLDERFLNLEEKYGYDGTAIFAAQLLADDLIEKLAKRN